jgi:hypothetical protein
VTVAHLSTCASNVGRACTCGADSERTEAEAREEAAPVVLLVDQIKALRREIALRERVYPKWIGSGRMKKPQADAEIAAMKAAHNTLSTAIDLLKLSLNQDPSAHVKIEVFLRGIGASEQ